MASKKEDPKKDPAASLAELEKAVARPKKAKAAQPAGAPVSQSAAAREVKAAAPRAKASAGSFRIRLVRSGICAPKDQKATLLGLGLRRIRQEVVRGDTPAMRGIIHKVRHLVEVTER